MERLDTNIQGLDGLIRMAAEYTDKAKRHLEAGGGATPQLALELAQSVSQIAIATGLYLVVISLHDANIRAEIVREIIEKKEEPGAESS